MPAHSFTPEQAAPLVAFADERHAIYLRKTILAGEFVPAGFNPAGIRDVEDFACQGDGYSLDPILNSYRFCNVFRELDRVTMWIRTNIREPFADHEHLWFMLAIARFVNWPPTLFELIAGVDYRGNMHNSWPSIDPGFDLREMTSVMEVRRKAGQKVETGAYMIRAESDPKKPWYSWTKQRYIAEVVLGRPWRDRAVAQRFFSQQRSLAETWAAMYGPADWVGWGPFMAGQVVADLRHTRYLHNAPDVGRWAPLGPGSTRGLNRLAGRPVKAPVKQADGLAEMLQLRDIVNSSTGIHVPPIELHDIQNCLCEVDKYLRVKTGEGEPRARYVPGRGF